MRAIQEFIEDSQKMNRVSVEEAGAQIMKILEADYEDGDWEISSRLKAYDILDITLTCKQNGTANDFHNYAVSFAKIGDFDAACDIIKCGLKRFPFDLDLIADFLEYAPNNSDENRFEECDQYYKSLREIEMDEWTWRAFSFSIDYLLAKLAQSLKDKAFIKSELQMVSSKYLEKYPSDERAYFSAYLIAQRFGSEDERKEVLNKAISLPIRAAHCALKLAELYFIEKNYSQSLEYLNRAIQDGIDLNGSIKLVNIYLLRFTVKVSIIMNELGLKKTNGLIDSEAQEQIKDAIDDYRKAKGLGMDQSKVGSYNQYEKLLRLTSGTPGDEDDDID